MVWFLHAQYCKNDHPTFLSSINNASPNWGRMSAIKEVAQPYSRWLIGNGNIEAYWEKWFLPFSSTYLPLHYFFREDGLPDEQKIVQDLGKEVFEEILKENITFSSTRDVCIWDLSLSSTFSLTLAWELIMKSSIFSNC